MIIYKNSIKNFIEQCRPKNNDLLIKEIKTNMKDKIGRGVSPAEEHSWRTTLIKISKYFSDIQNKANQYILLEFKIPLTQKRIDVILVGANGNEKNILIIELKGWSRSIRTDLPSQIKIDSKYLYVNHPLYEANEYLYLIKNQFADINNKFDSIDSVALLPNYSIIKNDPLYDDKFKYLMPGNELFHKSNIDTFSKIINIKFNTAISQSYAKYFNNLNYKPTPLFQSILETNHKKIKLFGSQKTAYEIIIKSIEEYYERGQKTLITVSGMAGSGKTIVALKVLSYIMTNKKLTAKLQLPGPEFRESIISRFSKNAFVNMIGGSYAKSEQEILILDEAHKQGGQGTAQQYYKDVFNLKNFVVALIDNNQVINKQGFTKSQIIEIAEKNNFKIIELYLQEQFRTRGDATYLDWLENWILNKQNYQKIHINNSSKMKFNVLSAGDFIKQYKNDYDRQNTRMVSFWTQPWMSELNSAGMPKRKVKIGHEKFVWNVNKFWVKELKKQHKYILLSNKFKDKLLKKNFNIDKKGWEYVAYFNTIQGAEFDNIYVHLPKLFYLNFNNEIDVDLSKLELYDMKTQIWMKNKKPNPEKEKLNKQYFLNRLIVNLTRGKKATYVYCDDPALQNWLINKVK